MANLSMAQQQFLKRRRRHKQMVTLTRILILVFFLLLWEVSTRLEWVDSFIFSSPSRVLTTLMNMVADKSLFLHIGITLAETLLSFVLVVILGIFAAVLLWLSNKLSEVLEPYLVVLNSLPKSALAPLLIVWLGANMKTIIIAGMSVAIFGSILNLYTGFQEVDQDKIKLIYTLQGKKKDALFKVVLPSTIPTIISIMKVNIGLCLVGVVIGEFISSKQGLGYLIIYGTQVFKLDLVIMSIFILCVIATGLYALISWVEKMYLKRI